MNGVIAIWPLYDDELFIEKLNKNPDIMNFKFGPTQETLLHRYVYYFRNHVVIRLN